MCCSLFLKGKSRNNYTIIAAAVEDRNKEIKLLYHISGTFLYIVLDFFSTKKDKIVGLATKVY